MLLEQRNEILDNLRSAKSKMSDAFMAIHNSNMSLTEKNIYFERINNASDLLGKIYSDVLQYENVNQDILPCQILLKRLKMII